MKRSIVALLVILGIFALACGFLDSDIATVTYEDSFPVRFSIDADQVCPPDIDCSATPAEANEERELLDIEFGVDVDIIEALERAAEEGEVQVKDPRSLTERMRSIEVTSIDYETDDNTLTFDVPDLAIHVGPTGSRKADDDGTVHLTTIDSIPALETASGNAPVREDASEPSSELFQGLQFAAIPAATPTVKEGQPFPPSGKTDMTLIFNIKLEANPLDSL